MEDLNAKYQAIVKKAMLTTQGVLEQGSEQSDDDIDNSLLERFGEFLAFNEFATNGSTHGGGKRSKQKRTKNKRSKKTRRRK
jgi:hypothetical protein